MTTRKGRIMARAFAVVIALAVAGCLTQQQLIERRIAQKADYFSKLPAENQQRLRAGFVLSGDDSDAVWIVYGRPDRVFQKMTTAGTNEVWSYVAQEAVLYDEPRPVYFPVLGPNGRTVWRAETLWAPRTFHSPYEYLRIEFHEGRVTAVESEKW